MKRLIFIYGLLSVALGADAQMKSGAQEKTVMVGGAMMYPSKNIIDNAVNSADHTTLVAAIKAAALVEVLQGKGPFSVFAPTNDAFAKLPPGDIDKLLMKENKVLLSSILTYHVVPGKLDSKELLKLLGNKNAVELKTVEGGNVWVMKKRNQLWLKDAKGGMSAITIRDVYQSNGVIHVVDTVLMPD